MASDGGQAASAQAKKPFLEPFAHGWRRELVHRNTVDEATGRRVSDIYYFTPQGKKLRSYREIRAALTVMGSSMPIKCFSFNKCLLGQGPPLETERLADFARSSRALSGRENAKPPKKSENPSKNERHHNPKKVLRVSGVARVQASPVGQTPSKLRPAPQRGKGLVASPSPARPTKRPTMPPESKVIVVGRKPPVKVFAPQQKPVTDGQTNCATVRRPRIVVVPQVPRKRPASSPPPPQKRPATAEQKRDPTMQPKVVVVGRERSQSTSSPPQKKPRTAEVPKRPAVSQEVVFVEMKRSASAPASGKKPAEAVPVTNWRELQFSRRMQPWVVLRRPPNGALLRAGGIPPPAKGAASRAGGAPRRPVGAPPRGGGAPRRPGGAPPLVRSAPPRAGGAPFRVGGATPWLGGAPPRLAVAPPRRYPPGAQLLRILTRDPGTVAAPLPEHAPTRKLKMMVKGPPLPFPAPPPPHEMPSAVLRRLVSARPWRLAVVHPGGQVDCVDEPQRHHAWRQAYQSQLRAQAGGDIPETLQIGRIRRPAGCSLFCHWDARPEVLALPELRCVGCCLLFHPECVGVHVPASPQRADFLCSHCFGLLMRRPDRRLFVPPSAPRSPAHRDSDSDSDCRVEQIVVVASDGESDPPSAAPAPAPALAVTAAAAEVGWEQLLLVDRPAESGSSGEESVGTEIERLLSLPRKAGKKKARNAGTAPSRGLRSPPSLVRAVGPPSLSRCPPPSAAVAGPPTLSRGPSPPATGPPSLSRGDTQPAAGPPPPTAGPPPLTLGVRPPPLQRAPAVVMDRGGQAVAAVVGQAGSGPGRPRRPSGRGCKVRVTPPAPAGKSSQVVVVSPPSASASPPVAAIAVTRQPACRDPPLERPQGPREARVITVKPRTLSGGVSEAGTEQRRFSAVSPPVKLKQTGGPVGTAAAAPQVVTVTVRCSPRSNGTVLVSRSPYTGPPESDTSPVSGASPRDLRKADSPLRKADASPRKTDAPPRKTNASPRKADASPRKADASPRKADASPRKTDASPRKASVEEVPVVKEQRSPSCEDGLRRTSAAVKRVAVTAPAGGPPVAKKRSWRTPGE